MTMSFNYFQCPVLVAWGEKDPWDPINLGRAYGNFDAAPQVSPLSNEVTLYSSSYCISVNFAGWEAGNGEPTYWISRCETFKVQYSPCSRHLISVSFTLFVYLYRTYHLNQHELSTCENSVWQNSDCMHIFDEVEISVKETKPFAPDSLSKFQNLHS